MQTVFSRYHEKHSLGGRSAFWFPVLQGIRMCCCSGLKGQGNMYLRALLMPYLQKGMTGIFQTAGQFLGETLVKFQP